MYAGVCPLRHVGYLHPHEDKLVSEILIKQSHYAKILFCNARQNKSSQTFSFFMRLLPFSQLFVYFLNWHSSQSGTLESYYLAKSQNVTITSPRNHRFINATHLNVKLI